MSSTSLNETFLNLLKMRAARADLMSVNCVFRRDTFDQRAKARFALKVFEERIAWQKRQPSIAFGKGGFERVERACVHPESAVYDRARVARHVPRRREIFQACERLER